MLYILWYMIEISNKDLRYREGPPRRKSLQHKELRRVFSIVVSSIAATTYGNHTVQSYTTLLGASSCGGPSHPPFWWC